MKFYTMHITTIDLHFFSYPYLFYLKPFSSALLIGMHLKVKENAEQEWTAAFD
jgi:hypothetical protein